jgi:hypothetical protein
LRVTVASDTTGVLSVDDNGGNLSVDLGGTAATLNTGTVDAGTQRVTLATDVALPAGTNAIGKLAANSGVDIGDVDVTSIAAGSNLIGDVGLQPRTSGGISTVYRDEDIDETAVAVKGSAGQIYWIHVINLDATPVYLHFYDVAQGSVTVGTTGELMTFCVPSQGDANGAGFTQQFPHGIQFSTAITAACTTTIGGTTGPGANEVILNVGDRCTGRRKAPRPAQARDPTAALLRRRRPRRHLPARRNGARAEAATGGSGGQAGGARGWTASRADAAGGQRAYRC